MQKSTKSKKKQSDIHFYVAHILLIFRTIQPNRGRAILHKFVHNYIYLQKKNISDMHHCITYMYIHFQQNLVSRLVKTVYTNLFAKHRELHKFATTNSDFK